MSWTPFPSTISADSPGFPGTSESGDRLGSALYGNHIGIPAEDVGSAKDAGAVCTLDPAGFTVRGGLRARCRDENSPGVPGAARSGDRFGASLVEICNGSEDICSESLMVGVPGRDSGSRKNVGRVLVLDSPAVVIPVTSQAGAGWGTGLMIY